MNKFLSRTFAVVFAISLAAAVALAGPVTKTFSNSFPVNGMPFTVKRTETTNGTNKKVDMVGTCSITSGQTLTRVDMYWNYNGRPLGQVVGSIPSATTWKASVGDFQLDSYYLRFQIKKGTQTLSYVSPTFTYGKP